jgi:hypothetical protein
MHPIMVLAFILLAAVALAPISYLASAPDALPVDARPVDAGPVDAGPVDAGPVDAGPVAAGPQHRGVIATPNHDPHRARVARTATAVAVPTPNHDAHRVHPVSSFALNPVALRAGPEPAAASTPGFADADTTLYAKDHGRLRAAPSTAAEILATLAADTPLRAVARSTDGAWWRVSLADGGIGYIHRIAVTEDRLAKPNPPAAPAPVVAVAPSQPVSAHRRQGLLGYVDKTMNWLADVAGQGSAPTFGRTER